MMEAEAGEIGPQTRNIKGCWQPQEAERDLPDCVSH